MPVCRSFALWLALLLAQGSVGFTQAIGSLYPPRPPAGSAFVRVVNGEAATLRVRIGTRAPQDELSGEATTSSIYRILPGNSLLALEINGKVQNKTIMVPADRFVTLIVKRDNGQFKFNMIVEEAARLDGLRADLRFYNLINGCEASLYIIDGSRIFDAIATNASAHRSINPVQARLSATCGTARSADWTLPALKPGDHFSLFLIGSAESPKLAGQLDQTEPYQGPTE